MIVKTAQEANEILEGIDILKSCLYKTDLNEFEETMTKYDMLRSLFGTIDVSMGNRDVIIKVLDDKKKEIQNTDKIKIAFAFQPNNELLEKVYAWLSANAGHNLIVDVSVNPEILGGVVVIFNGLYKDYSLKSKMDKYFSSHTKAYDLF